MLGAKKLGYSPGPSILKVKVECDTSWLYRYHTCGYLVNSNDTIGGAAIAQWTCLCLPPCRPGFEFQAYHLCFFHFVLYLSCEKNENKQKEGGFGILKNDTIREGGIPEEQTGPHVAMLNGVHHIKNANF